MILPLIVLFVFLLQFSFANFFDNGRCLNRYCNSGGKIGHHDSVCARMCDSIKNSESDHYIAMCSCDRKYRKNPYGTNKKPCVGKGCSEQFPRNKPYEIEFY